MRESTPLLIVGHGTVDERGVGEFLGFVNRMRGRLGADGVDVAGGFIELAAPAVAEAWRELAGRGHSRLAAVPLVLVAAGHAKGDIPAALGREMRRHPGTGYAFGRPLGPHPILLSLLAERIGSVVSSGEWSTCAVLLVGRGSTDPDANAEVCKVARLLQETRGFAFVETAFVSLARPDVTEGLDRARMLGARRVVVAPYFLFDGVLPQRVASQAEAFAAGHPEMTVTVAGHIGDCDGLAEVVVERYREALHGDIRMNCDTCAYRVLLPGFEDKLHAPQTPHHHPHDPTGNAHGHGDGDGDGPDDSDGPGDAHSDGPGDGHSDGHGPGDGDGDGDGWGDSLGASNGPGDGRISDSRGRSDDRSGSDDRSSNGQGRNDSSSHSHSHGGAHDR
jgi:sirohydrochlorin cobaltochelatase